MPIQYQTMDSLPNRMGKGDEQAYQEFANVFGPRLRTYFRRRGLELVDAEELAISCVTDIALTTGKFAARGSGSFERWVFKCAINMLNDWFRQQRPSISLSEDLVGSPESDPAVVSASAPNELIACAVAEALEELNSEDRTIVSLRLLEVPYSFAEIGTVVKLTENAARVRYHRAMTRLRKILEKNPTIEQRLQRTEAKSKELNHGKPNQYLARVA